MSPSMCLHYISPSPDHHTLFLVDRVNNLLSVNHIYYFDDQQLRLVLRPNNDTTNCYPILGSLMFYKQSGSSISFYPSFTVLVSLHNKINDTQMFT